MIAVVNDCGERSGPRKNLSTLLSTFLVVGVPHGSRDLIRDLADFDPVKEKWGEADFCTQMTVL